MKTSVVMVRKMGAFDVSQRTKDGMFNATELLKQWNENPNNPQRNLGRFWEQDGVKAFIEVMMKEENLDTPLEAYHKSKANKGVNAGTWMHPILFIKFAMWINPVFEYHVIKFVHDQLIAFRNDAGDNYIGLTSAVQRLEGIDYSLLAKGLNWIVFNKHENGIRQKATSEQLKELVEVQKKLAFAVDMNYIKTFTELINEMRRFYEHKHRTSSILSFSE